MERNRLCPPQQCNRLITAIHWACLAAKTDPSILTILISPDTNWYQNFNPHSSPFSDTHIITHFAADTITYEEPTIPPELNIPREELSTLQIFCITHQNNNIA